MQATHTVKVLWQKEDMHNGQRRFIHGVQLDDEKRTVRRRRISWLPWWEILTYEDRIVNLHTEMEAIPNRSRIYKLATAWEAMCAIFREYAKRELRLEGADLAGLREDVLIVAPPEIVESWQTIVLPEEAKPKTVKHIPIVDGFRASGMNLAEYYEKHIMPEAELLYQSVPDLDMISDEIAVDAVISSNRVIVKCGCGWECPVWLATPQIFCPQCRNKVTGGSWLEVLLPDNFDDILTVLEKRPDPRTRNWNPSETVEDLIRENEEHGII